MKGLLVARKLALMVAATTVLVGCSGQANQSSAPPSSCPVTRPNGSSPSKNAGFNHGNGVVWVALWPRGKLLAGPLPDGSSWAEVGPDGSIRAKLGWWRGVKGRLTITGRRLDALAPRLGSEVSAGYGVSGFQPSGLIFPSEGCWEVTGKVGEAKLRFVTLVVKA
jgi:hypothetical protein